MGFSVQQKTPRANGTRGDLHRGSTLVYHSKPGNGGKPEDFHTPLAPGRTSRGVPVGPLSAGDVPLSGRSGPRYSFRSTRYSVQGLSHCYSILSRGRIGVKGRRRDSTSICIGAAKKREDGKAGRVAVRTREAGDASPLSSGGRGRPERCVSPPQHNFICLNRKLLPLFPPSNRIVT